MSELQDKYIRFDWAIKRLLRQKANFGVLEGFLTVFLGEPITIVEILESESNQASADDKFNRVDIKARNSKGDIIIIEVQNTRELYYLERVLYGVAKAITEHINLGNFYTSFVIYSKSALYKIHIAFKEQIRNKTVFFYNSVFFSFHLISFFALGNI